ncbi:MAG: DUF2442 domain-containing protein [Bacteroidales bacterium]|nr:DUF2442 domain-containing protein [Bacteroidales bacterium]MDD3666511.1 DUF2442 domain-containing protein [Bacteroidales bacterium]
MYNSVVSVSPIGDYRLKLTFDNGEVRAFDMKPFLHLGLFRELKDEALFNTVRISFDSIQWENDADFDPESLYNLSRPFQTTE